MKRVIYTISFAVLAASASAQVVSSAKFYVSEGAVVSMGQDFQNNGELVNKGDLHLKKNLINNGELESTGNVYLDGYGQSQELSGSQAIVLNRATVENDVNLSTSLLIEKELDFRQGVLNSDENSPLVFAENASHVGASDFSHAKGTVTKLSANRFEFPVGDGTNYRGFEANSAEQGALTSTYHAENTAALSSDLAQGVERVNANEYWVLKSSNENDVANVKVSNTYDNNVAYLKKGTWTMAENESLDKNAGLSRGVVFTTGRGQLIKKDIGIWPNPTQGDFNLKLAGMNDSDEVMVDITNQDGRIVMRKTGKVSELRRVYSLPPGMVTTELTVRVVHADEVLTEKLILNR
ncbi:T9SS type A sorting domain-containing protein [Marinilongibacter aquaticus]|uniref:T9SS type A sorting domain-containing protein n=1 Tax=Marinilongibacter aquaticus TaxID=2975157 RepID=UPI0021BD1101|nr:T9SS type A sorting domain-containing protein [Marinilongibacter aquaticus]UBM60276.1 T9SS type A sorting domain-containing protein [Marinilongibacter aquaticus]